MAGMLVDCEGLVKVPSECVGCCRLEDKCRKRDDQPVSELREGLGTGRSTTTNLTKTCLEGIKAGYAAARENFFCSFAVTKVEWAMLAEPLSIVSYRECNLRLIYPMKASNRHPVVNLPKVAERVGFEMKAVVGVLDATDSFGRPSVPTSLAARSFVDIPFYLCLAGSKGQ